MELTLQYAVSEDGTNDVVEVSVTKFRCSVQTMQEHEKIGGEFSPKECRIITIMNILETKPTKYTI